MASWTLGLRRRESCPPVDCPRVAARDWLHASYQRHLHCGLHGAHRRLARRRALSRPQGRCRAPRRSWRWPRSSAWRWSTPSATACATAAISATRSPICRAAPPTSPARWARSAAGSPPWKTASTRAVDRARGAVDPIAAEIGELGGLVRQIAETVASHAAVLQQQGALTPAASRRRPPSRYRRRADAERKRRGERPPLPQSEPRGHRRADRQGGRRQPHRSLSAADRHAAATQGALLRGAVAAAHRGRRRHHRRRLHRLRRKRRPDAEDRQPAAVPLRAGDAPPAIEEPRRRPVLQCQRLDAERSDVLPAIPRFHGRQPRARQCADVRIHASAPIARSGRSSTKAWRRWPNAASASPWITSPTCAWSRRNWPTARSASSRCRRRCCSIPSTASQSDIHPGDLADLLARSGIDLIAERIESESMVVDLLDCDVRFGQGFLFSPPRPVRAEALQGGGEADATRQRERRANWSPPARPPAERAVLPPLHPAFRDAGARLRRAAVRRLGRGA